MSYQLRMWQFLLNIIKRWSEAELFSKLEKHDFLPLIYMFNFCGFLVFCLTFDQEIRILSTGSVYEKKFILVQSLKKVQSFNLSFNPGKTHRGTLLRLLYLEFRDTDFFVCLEPVSTYFVSYLPKGQLNSE